MGVEASDLSQWRDDSWAAVSAMGAPDSQSQEALANQMGAILNSAATAAWMDQCIESFGEARVTPDASWMARFGPEKATRRSAREMVPRPNRAWTLECDVASPSEPLNLYLVGGGCMVAGRLRSPHPHLGLAASPDAVMSYVRSGAIADSLEVTGIDGFSDREAAKETIQDSLGRSALLTYAGRTPMDIMQDTLNMAELSDEELRAYGFNPETGADELGLDTGSATRRETSPGLQRAHAEIERLRAAETMEEAEPAIALEV